MLRYLLSSELVGPACVQARSSNPRGRVCGPSGKGLGEEGILSGVVPVYLYCPAFNVSVSLGVQRVQFYFFIYYAEAAHIYIHTVTISKEKTKN